MKHPIQSYFSISELVSKPVAAKFGQQAWSFFDPRILDVLLWLRQSLCIPLVVNTPTLQQRGLRENTCQLVADKTKKSQLYCSAHTRGQAVDFSSGKMSAKDIRRWIRANIQYCPHPIRLENDKSAPTWVHIDVCNTSSAKLQEFSA